MKSSMETKILNSVCILLVLLAGFTRLAMQNNQKSSYNSMICGLFAAAILIWIYQLRRRLLQPNVRRNLTVAAGLMMFWIVIRTIKYEFLPSGHFSGRYVWYLYYFPMIFVPLLMFLSTLYIGKPHDRSISSWWKLLYIPAVLLLGGILTNDFHQLAFFFPDGLAHWDHTDGIHGPVYYGVMVWMLILFLVMMIVVFRRCAVPDNRKKIWIPILPLLLGVLYTMCILLDQNNILTRMITVPEIGCFIFAAFMESFIIVHLFPSNDSYGDFWKASSIGAGIMREDGVICYKSNHSIPVTPRQIREAQVKPVLLENGSAALQSHRIQGGFGYFTRNLSEINRLNQELADVGDVLAEENSMLEAENKMEENRIRLQQQNALYDGIARRVSSQLEQINRLLLNPEEEEAAFEETIKYACILNCYVKRCSNLLLLSHQSSGMSGEELCLALSESLEYIRLYGIKSHGAYHGQGQFPGDWILLAYEVFELVAESAIPGANALLVTVNMSEDTLCLGMELNAPREPFEVNALHERLSSPGTSLQVDVENETEYVSLMLSLGGASV